jgi:hypothetical protein
MEGAIGLEPTPPQQLTALFGGDLIDRLYKSLTPDEFQTYLRKGVSRPRQQTDHSG